MLRHLLVEATGIHDGTAPNYLLEQIGQRTHASCRDAERIAECLLERLAKSNLNVKLKAMEAINYCMHEGNQIFASTIYQSHYEIEKYLDTQPISNSMYSENKYMRLRVLAAEILNPDPVRRSGSPLSSLSSSPRSATLSPASDSSYPGTKAIDSPSTYGRTSSSAISQLSSGYDHTFQTNAFAANASPALISWKYDAATATYDQNVPCESYSAYMNDDGPQTGKLTDSTAASLRSGSSLVQLQASTATKGVWSCAGFQKFSSSTTRNTFADCKSLRDNAPMTLAGCQPAFARPSPSHTADYAFSAKLPKPNDISIRDCQSAVPSRNEVGTGSHTCNGWQSSQGNCGTERKSKSLVHESSENTTSKLSKTMEGLVKMSLEAKERWDCRNLEKSMASSLVDNNVLSSVPMDCNDLVPKVTHDETEAAGSYERGLVEKMCTSGGISRAPPASEIKRFITLAQNLHVATIGSNLLEKCCDPVWQVRLKSLFVVLALLDAPGCAAYYAYFQQNASALLQLKLDKKTLVVAKAVRILALLNVASRDADRQRIPENKLDSSTKPSAEPQLIDLELPAQQLSPSIGLI
uniref:Uncharacterized protein AlNc14C113G6452 n=1 Tax=Albugo laibachii Nc14 TaxID=890382 RepID=F0WIR7_9STRA|nr:conserved hypothetical protein [Albugo laibachii Nc14]|eukprot:CCA21161.1 conserved hypothetical protein [Albugo laibachii Nc14]